MASLEELTVRYNELLAERARLAAIYNSGDTTVLPEIQAVNAEISSVIKQINAAENPPVASAGSVQQEGSNARDSGAIQNPPPATLVVKQEDINKPVDIGPAPAEPVPTNADKTETSASVPKEKVSPDKLSNGSAPTRPASTSNGASATPAQNTGLLEPSKQSQATQSYIYRAKEVTHVFDRGRFTQEIVGSLIVFPYPPNEEKKKESAENKKDEAGQGNENSQTQTALKASPPAKTNLSPSISSKALGTNPNAGKSNALANALSLPPTSGGQPVGPSFSEDVARRKQTIITPQQINREP